MEYRVIAPLTGLINGREWPPVGGIIEIGAVLAMPELEEIRPASEAGVEKRPARKRVARP